MAADATAAAAGKGGKGAEEDDLGTDARTVLTGKVAGKEPLLMIWRQVM